MDFLRVRMVFRSLFSERRLTQFRSQLSAERGTRYHSCFPLKSSPQPPQTCLSSAIRSATTYSTGIKQQQEPAQSPPPPQPRQNRRYFNILLVFSDEQTAARGRRAAGSGGQAERQRRETNLLPPLGSRPAQTQL